MKNLFLLDLHLFDEGSVGAAEGAAIASDDGLKADDVVDNAKDSNKDNNDNSLAKSDKSTKPSFEELIEGEYKDDYKKAVNSVIKKRFKNVKDTQAKLDSYVPLMETLASRYGLNADASPEDFMNAIYDDDALYENEALERGIPVDVLKRMKKMERENETMSRILESKQMEQENAEFIENLMLQAEEVKQFYPDFDLDHEVLEADTKEKFIRYTKDGFDMKQVYELLHPEIFTMAMKAVADKTAEKIANNVKVNKSRPVEGGSGITGSVARTSINDMTKDDLDKLIARSRYERITLK